MDYNENEKNIWEIYDDLKNELNNIEKERNGLSIDPLNPLKCHCGGTEFIVEDTMHICKECSSVLGRIIDSTAEWRYYGNDDNRDSDPSRCGMPVNTLLPKSSLGSMIGGTRKDNIDIRRIRMYQMWNSMPYDERTLWNVFDKLESLTSNNGIPQKVIDDAKVFYKKTSEKKISRGDNKEGLIASCIYHSCLINEIPRSSKEIAKMFNISHVILNKGNSRFQQLLQINVISSNPEDFISRFGSRLNMKINDITNCKNLIKFLEKNEVMNDNSPTSSAAAILYYYTIKNNLGFTKKQFSEICSVSEVTIIKCYKNICKFDDFINDNINEIYNL
jgi:transcription initiation factor TFIIB